MGTNPGVYLKLWRKSAFIWEQIILGTIWEQIIWEQSKRIFAVSWTDIVSNI